MNRKAMPDARDLRPASSTFANGWLDDSCFVGKSYRSGSITVVLNGLSQGQKKTSLRKTTWNCCSCVKFKFIILLHEKNNTSLIK